LFPPLLPRRAFAALAQADYPSKPLD